MYVYGGMLANSVIMYNFFSETRAHTGLVLSEYVFVHMEFIWNYERLEEAKTTTVIAG